MSPLAATADAAASGWNVTTSIAAAAAAISLVTLIVTTIATGRREHVRWAREALAEAFYGVVDTSYAAAAATAAHQEALWNGAAGDATATAGRLEDRLVALRTEVTRIRLLAPSATVEKAQAVRRAHAALRDALAPDLDPERYRSLVRAVAAEREEMIRSAKRAMALPR